jgi:hypothetical protein
MLFGARGKIGGYIRVLLVYTLVSVTLLDMRVTRLSRIGAYVVDNNPSKLSVETHYKERTLLRVCIYTQGKFKKPF